MGRITATFRNLPGTGAAVGWAGARTLVADRPEGRAGGTGLGFNGGEMLALSIGGCLCNDLRYVAEARELRCGEIAVEVEIELGGEPALVTGARVRVRAALEDGGDASALIAAAASGSTVSNSLARGFPVIIEEAP